MSQQQSRGKQPNAPSATATTAENDDEVDLYSGIEFPQALAPAKQKVQPLRAAPSKGSSASERDRVEAHAPSDKRGADRLEQAERNANETSRVRAAPDPSISDDLHDSDEEDDAEEEDQESSDDDVDIILGSSQPAIGEQAAKFAASWNEVAKEGRGVAEQGGTAPGLGMMNAEASLQSSALLQSMLPQPTMANVAPGKQRSLYEVELEQLDEKPWREPGAVLSDYFNYGFTEETWKIYCQHQAAMRQETSVLHRQVTMNQATASRERDKPTRPGQAGAGSAAISAGNARERPPRRAVEEEKPKRDVESTAKSTGKGPGTAWKVAGLSPSLLPSKNVLERLAQVRQQIMSQNTGAQTPESSSKTMHRHETTSSEANSGEADRAEPTQATASDDRTRKRKRVNEEPAPSIADRSR